MFVLVNLKAYDVDPVAIGRAAAEVGDDSGVRIAVAPQAADLRPVADTGVETWAQHVAPVSDGSHTGHQLATRIADAGATGTLLNHSERRLRLADIDTGIGIANAAGLETVICANNPAQIAAVTTLGPDAVAVEPPELIGTGTPVSQADPSIVRDAVERVGEVDPAVALYCGAGISTGADLAAAAELGADGVLLASGVAKAEDPKQALTDLVSEV
jgi:triosephosphate isomerase